MKYVGRWSVTDTLPGSEKENPSLCRMAFSWLNVYMYSWKNRVHNAWQVMRFELQGHFRSEIHLYTCNGRPTLQIKVCTLQTWDIVNNIIINSIIMMHGLWCIVESVFRGTWLADGWRGAKEQSILATNKGEGKNKTYTQMLNSSRQERYEITSYYAPNTLILFLIGIRSRN
jgi:hypothetical protein